MKKRYLRVKDLKEPYGLAKDLVYKLVRAQKIPAIKIGRLILFEKSALDTWFEKHRIGMREVN